MSRLFALILAMAAACFAIAPVIAPRWGLPDLGGYAVRQDGAPSQPAPYAYAIWILIHGWLVVASVFGLLRRADDADWAAMRPVLSASLALGVLWQIAIPVAPMGALLVIWLMLGTGLKALFSVGDTDRWLQLTPVALYCGWVTAEAAISLGLILGGEAGINGTIAALIALSLGLAIAVAVQYQLHRAPEYGLAVIWALVAIVVANWQPFNVAVCGVAILGILAILSLRSTDTE
ncbi:MAG: hypothetical protein ACPG7W_08225 [Paracoccaceae bacterium]